MGAIHRWLTPGIVLPLYEALSGRRPWTQTRRLRTLQWRSPEELEARALEKLRPLLTRAATRVPHYRDLFRRAGLRSEDVRTIADLSRLPPTTKADLRAVFPDGAVAGDLPARRRIAQRTSGSSGSPFEFFADREEEDAQRASFLLFQEWAGAALRDVRIHVGARSGGARRGGLNPTGPPGLVRWALLGQETVLLSGADLTARALRDRTARLPAGRRYYVVAYASLALNLARELLDGGIELAPGPALVICGGESLSAAHAEVVARGFRCRTVNRYSALEAAFVAQTCPDHPALLHVNSERAILRVVRSDGTPAPPGEEGRLLVTNLDNHVMPFINYDIGDWAVAGRPCPCGRGFPTLDRVEGRLLELIRTPAGRVISPTALGHFLSEDHPVWGRVRDYQAVQTAADAVTLRVVPAPRFDAEFAAGLRAALQAFLGADVTASVEVVASIPTEPSGKRFIIRGATPVP